MEKQDIEDVIEQERPSSLRSSSSPITGVLLEQAAQTSVPAARRGRKPKATEKAAEDGAAKVKAKRKQTAVKKGNGKASSTLDIYPIIGPHGGETG